MRNNKRKIGQNLLEYLLIATIVAVVSGVLISKVDFRRLKDFVFIRPSNSASQVEIPSMTPEN